VVVVNLQAIDCLQIKRPCKWDEKKHGREQLMMKISSSSI